MEWAAVDEQFLKNPPAWFLEGELWVADGALVKIARYEWQQGHAPDRLVGVEVGNVPAAGRLVAPMVRPVAPGFGGR